MYHLNILNYMFYLELVAMIIGSIPFFLNKGIVSEKSRAVIIKSCPFSAKCLYIGINTFTCGVFVISIQILMLLLFC